MRQGQYCVVTHRFTGKKVNGPFYEIFEPGTQLVFVRSRGEAEGISVFTTIQPGQLDSALTPLPGSLYEAKHALFDACTSALPK